MEYLITLNVDPLPIPSNWFDQVLGPYGVVVLLLVLFIAMVRGWLVSGTQHKQVLKERDEWRDVALKGLSKGEELVEIVRLNGAK